MLTGAHPMANYLGRRGLHFVVSMVVLVTAAFLLMRLVPGDPALLSAGPTAPPALVEQRRIQLGLNLPLWEQYLTFWRGLFTGDLGYSISSRTSVISVLGARIPATLALALPAVALVLIFAVPLGLAFGAWTRRGRRRVLDLGFNSVTGFLAVVPEFLIGVVLVAFFAVQLKWFPVAGRSGFVSYVLPVVALTIGPLAGMTRIVRAETIGVLDQDYMRTARSKRLPTVRLYLRHALPNLLTATLTVSGLLLGGMIAGTVLVENIFGWPGLGMTIVESIKGKDYPLVQAIVVFYGAVVLLINLVVDVVLIALDPRTTLEAS